MMLLSSFFLCAIPTTTILLLLLCGSFQVSHGLSNSNNAAASPPLPKPVKRIAIVGAGISGLSVAHALTNNNVNHKNTMNNMIDTTVDIFDSRMSLDATAGAGIQLNGGLSILGRINTQLQENVYNAGIPQVGVQSQSNAWGFGTRKDDTAADHEPTVSTLLKLDLQQTVESAGGDVAMSLLSSSSSQRQQQQHPPKRRRLWWISIMRGALQDVLYTSLPPHIQKQTTFNKKLIQLQPESIDGGVYCVFADGTKSGPYDLVIGCEGINSVINNYIDTDGRPTPTSQSSPLLKKSAFYSGLRIRYAVADGDPSQPIVETNATLTQFFGNGAYALHGVYGAGIGKPNTQCAFIVYLDDNYIGPFRKKQPHNEAALVREQQLPKVSTTTTTIREQEENADWSQDTRTAVDLSRENMLQQLRRCNIPCDTSTTLLGATIANASRFFELGSYYHNPFCKWSRSVRDCQAHVVLCGDAAHALPPFLGQGSNQAIQDAYCLVQQLIQYNEQVALLGGSNVVDDDSNNNNNNALPNLQTSFDRYESIRWLPCFNIFWKAAFLGYLETGGIDGYYSKFRDVFFRTMGIIGVASRVLLNAATPKV